ncbi:phenoloxidase-activating factor 2-like [Contarinia nasturtii]|uniref:phenoloxidase-activating factor 2-like n=1 Tax=Contarinia nasturtii TaxID=265458 RepID=UPI0012D453DE|nr:phenoloxidase-activating factor 2-like [Contarinia nasturtii]
MKRNLIIILMVIFAVNAMPQQDLSSDDYVEALEFVFGSSTTTTTTPKSWIVTPEPIDNVDSTFPTPLIDNQPKCTCVSYEMCNATSTDMNQVCENPLDVCCIGVAPTPAPTTQPKCECVPFHQCVNNKNIIKIRVDVGEQECASYLQICCAPSKIRRPSQNVTITPKIDVDCGKRNENGVGFKTTDDTDNESKFGEFPWAVAILEAQTTEEYLCGGSLIHQQVVLTAAHCIAKKGSQMLKVRAGEWDTRTTYELYPHQDRTVSNIVINPGFYHEDDIYNDVALLFLTQPFEITENVNTVCLPNPGDVFDNALCFATGWGKDKFDDLSKYQVILKKVELPIVPRQTCVQKLRESPLGTDFSLHPSFICAGGVPGRDTCTGDGGAPLVCPAKNSQGRYVQAGIVSWGVGCGEKTPGAYANVALFRNWVDEQLNLRNLR